MTKNKDNITDIKLKRKFNLYKFYKLVRILVIAITIISTIGVILYSHYYFSSEDFGEALKICQNANGRIDWNCIKDVGNIDSDGVNAFFTFLKISVILPILFYGGIWLYKYLFPFKKSE